jgi:hypothetical protein
MLLKFDDELPNIIHNDSPFFRWGQYVKIDLVKDEASLWPPVGHSSAAKAMFPFGPMGPGVPNDLDTATGRLCDLQVPAPQVVGESRSEVNSQLDPVHVP